MKKILFCALFMMGALNVTHAAEEQPSRFKFNVGIAGASTLITYSLMRRVTGNTTSACAAGSALTAMMFCCLVDGWSLAHQEDGYALLSLKDRIHRILHHTQQVLKTSQGTETIGNLAGTYFLLALFYPQIIAWCSQ